MECSTQSIRLTASNEPAGFDGRRRGGGGCYCNEEGVSISDFQMLADMKW